jgi:hypothetical protein
MHSLRNDALPIKGHVEIAGCGCSIHTNSASVVDSVENAWANHKDLDQQDFELAVLVDREFRRQTMIPQFRGLRQFVFGTFHGTDTFAFDLLNRRVSAVISDETAQDSGFWATVLMPIALGVMGPTMGVAPLHCACLAAGRRGMLVAGLSGAGKSTLAVALAREGLALVSDDWTYARGLDGSAEVHGLRVPVKLMPDTVRYFDELKSEQLRISLNGELAFEVDPRRTFGVEVSDGCEPEWIVFLQRSAGENRISPLDRSVAKKFFQQSAEPLPRELSNAAEMRHRIIQTVTDRDCWLFSYSGTPQQGAAMLRTFFRERFDGDRCCA